MFNPPKYTERELRNLAARESRLSCVPIYISSEKARIWSAAAICIQRDRPHRETQEDTREERAKKRIHLPRTQAFVYTNSVIFIRVRGAVLSWQSRVSARDANESEIQLCSRGFLLERENFGYPARQGDLVSILARAVQANCESSLSRASASLRRSNVLSTLALFSNVSGDESVKEMGKVGYGRTFFILSMCPDSRQIGRDAFSKLKLFRAL